MRHDKSNSPGRIPPLRNLAVLATSLMVILIYAGCGTQQSSDGNQNAGPRPTPPPIQYKGLSDTPIVISGGSVHLELNNTTFRPCTGAPTPCPAPTTSGNKMYWATGKINAGYYYDDNDNSPDTAYPITITSPSVTITIKSSGGGGSGDIIVKNDPGSNRVLVEFDETAKFKPLRTGSHRRVAKKFKVDKLLVKDGTNAEKDYSMESNWPAAKKVTIELSGTQ